jgi:hypothetical protein
MFLDAIVQHTGHTVKAPPVQRPTPGQITAKEIACRYSAQGVVAFGVRGNETSNKPDWL